MIPLTKEDSQAMADFRATMRKARKGKPRKNDFQGFGNDEQPCSYCHDEPGHSDPVLGWIGPNCERELTA